MDIKNKILLEDILRLNSNIALLNAVYCARIQKENENIKEDDFQRNLKLNNNILNKISKKNKEIQKENQKKKKNLNEIKINEIQKNMQIIRHLRNFYSHHLDEKPKKENEENEHQKSKKWINENEENVYEKFKKIFNNTSYFQHFENYKTNDWRIYFISLFLTNLEFKEMIKCIEENKIQINEKIKDSKSRSLRFRFSQVKLKEPIEDKLLNYIKNFNDITNYKKAFANQALNLLNWKWKKGKFKFKKEIDKGNFLFSLNCDEKKSLFNFSELRKVLLCTHPKKNITYKKKRQSNKNDDFKAFQNRFQTINAKNIRHLLKVFNKIFIKKNNNKELQQNIFENLFQDIHFNNRNREDIYILKEYDLKKEEVNPQIKKIIQILEIEDINKEIDLWEKIKNVINKEINSKEKFNEMYPKKNKEKENNNEQISNNKELMFFNVENKNLKNDFEYYTKNMNSKKDKYNFRKYLLPLIIFYKTNIPKKNNYIKIKDILEDNKKYIIERKFIKEIFEKRIQKDKNLKIYSNFKNEKFKNIIWNKEILKSNKEIISSKLFFEFFELLKKESIPNWNEFIKKINEYKKKEIILLKNIYNNHKKWQNNEEERKYRNYIMHRSISKFETLSDFKKIVDKKMEKGKIEIKKNIKNNLNKNKFKDIHETIENKKYENNL